MMKKMVALFCAAPMVVFAAGGGSSSPPPSTPTSTQCTGGMVWDASLGRCMAPRESSLNDDALYDAVRELAYADQPQNAQIVLSAMADQTEDRVLTYWGFTYGRMGQLEKGLQYYEAALAQNPDNILARSYMGQALVAAGRVDEARLQLVAIAERGAADTWAGRSLSDALRTGHGYNY